MTAISANSRLCQGMRHAIPGNKLDATNFSKNTRGMKSLATQFSSLRLAPNSPSCFFPSSSSSFSSSSYAAFHSSASIDGPKKKVELAPRSPELLPEKPKLPATSWIEFCSVNRPNLRRAQPNLAAPDILRTLAEMWKRISPSEKEKYQARYRARRAEYEREFAAWNQSVTTAEKNALTVAHREKKSAKDQELSKAKQKREKKALEAELGKPKKPLTTFLRFMEEQRREVGQQPKDFIKICSEKYKQLPASELERLTERYQADKKTYDVEMENWHVRMNQDGRSQQVGSRA